VKRFLTRNLGLKLLALVIAIFLWVLVTGENEAVHVYTARVDFLYPPDHTLAQETSGSVSVYVRGPELLLRGVDPGALSIVADLRRGPSGERQVVLNPETHLRGLPRGIAVERIVPQVLTVKLERKVRRPVPVMPRLEGEPAAGCRFAGYDIVPSEVLIEGAESLVNSVTMTQTEPIDISGRCQTFMLSVAASPEKPGVKVVTQRPVTVKVKLEKVPAERS